MGVEVLRESTRRVDPHEKRPNHAHQGVSCPWLVDPIDRTLAAFVLHNGQWVLNASAKDDEPVNIRLFEAITFSPGGLRPQSGAYRRTVDGSLARVAKQGTVARESPLSSCEIRAERPDFAGGCAG